MDRLEHRYCKGCNGRFFADEEEDKKFGEYYCSHCISRVQKCAMCDKVKVMKRITSNDVGICKECYSSVATFPNIWIMLRFKTFQRDNFTCRYCGRSPLKDTKIVLHCDHIYPKSKGGEDKLDNLVTACAECNGGKVDVLLNECQIHLVKNRKVSEDETIRNN